jgi:thiol-disulfide isomerase/thioredoxin
MKYLFTLFFIFLINTVNAQVKLLNFNELDKRLANGKDTSYVINFWATWCGPCIAELPNFEALRLANLKKPVKVILLSMDFKSKLKSDVVPFVNKQKLQSEVYVINEKDQHAFIEKVDKNWSGAIPATLFINTKNKKRLFFEKEFTYQELNKTLETIK